MKRIVFASEVEVLLEEERKKSGELLQLLEKKSLQCEAHAARLIATRNGVMGWQPQDLAAQKLRLEARNLEAEEKQSPKESARSNGWIFWMDEVPQVIHVSMTGEFGV